MKESQNINASNSTCYLETFRALTNEPGFIIACANILHPFVARAILEAHDPESHWKGNRNFK